MTSGLHFQRLLLYDAFMHYLSHRVIILLLLFLQGFTPLVHAHVNSLGFDRGSGVHIDGLSVALSGGSQLSDYDQMGYIPLAIGVNSAIQQKQTPKDRSENPGLATVINSVFPHRKLIEKQVGFSPPVIDCYSFSPADSTSPRAPPPHLFS